MAKIPGAPSGNRYGSGDLRSKKFTCRCYPGQSVTITRGLPNRCEPSRVTVVGEYEKIIVFKLEFDQEDWNGERSVVSWNYTISKASLLCGDAVVKDLSGRMIRPDEVEDESRRRRNDRRPPRPRTEAQEIDDSLI